jgi:hypothetical protein
MGKVGVGLKVEPTHAGYVVSELVPKGPAEASGKIRVGDLIVSVDGFPVGNAATLPPLMIGLQGTEVVIGFRRHTKGPVHEVRLQRQGPNPENSRHQRSRKPNDADTYKVHSPRATYAASSQSDTARPASRLPSRPHTSQGSEAAGHGISIDNLDLHATSMETLHASNQDLGSPTSHISLSYSFQAGAYPCDDFLHRIDRKHMFTPEIMTQKIHVCARVSSGNT